MSCCRAGPCEEVFRPRMARADLSWYRRRGLRGLARKMLAAVRRDGVAGARVLEIGGGIGVLQAELLLAGASRGEVVELLEAYRPYAQQLASELGITGRTTFRVHDLLADPAGVEPADVVLLNRVICCSPEGIELFGEAARLTRRSLAAQFPRDRAAVRTAVWVLNATQRVVGRRFRVYVHPRDKVLAAATAAGLTLHTQGRAAIWEYVTFLRPEPGVTGPLTPVTQ